MVDLGGFSRPSQKPHGINTPTPQATQTREEEEHPRGGSSGEGLEGDRVWEARTTVLPAPGWGNVVGAQLSVL